MAEYNTEQKKILLDFLSSNSTKAYTIDEITDAIENLEEDSEEGSKDGLNITITLNPDEDSSEKISILKSLFNTKKTEE